MSVQGEIFELCASFRSDYGAEQKRYAVTSTWASKLGHPCGERWLYFNLKNWEQAAQRNWGFRGEKGNLIHDWWKIHVMKKGYDVVQNEEPLSESIRSKYLIGGRIDGRVNKHGKRPIPYEFKSMSSAYYKKINSIEDMLDHPKDYIRAYPAQLQIYLFDKNEESGLFILCDSDSLEWKPIPVFLDYQYVEGLLKRAESVKLAKDQNLEQNPFPRIPYGSTCKFCEYAHVCLPEIRNEGLDIVDNEHLEGLLDERAKLQGYAEQFELIDKEAKEIAKSVGKDFIVGNSFSVNIKKSTFKKFDSKSVPPEIKKQYQTEQERVQIDFVPLAVQK